MYCSGSGGVFFLFHSFNSLSTSLSCHPADRRNVIRVKTDLFFPSAMPLRMLLMQSGKNSSGIFSVAVLIGRLSFFSFCVLAPHSKACRSSSIPSPSLFVRNCSSVLILPGTESSGLKDFISDIFIGRETLHVL